ncbi:alpha/beta hydrolase [Rhodoferax antarcticus]|nr:alpha/beta hydrolase [Rhodoferax antarcticus]
MKMLMAALLLALAAWLLWTPDMDRATLERRYLADPADMMMMQGINLHVRDTGPRNAPAVLMVHGMGGSLHSWEPWAQAMAPELRVIRLDLPGSGLSSPDPTGDYSDQRSIDVILALMDHLQLEKASVVGHSIGGRMAWRLAATHPERVNKLVLVAPDGFASPGFEYAKPVDVPSVLQLMRYALPKWLLRMNLKPAYANDSAMTDERITRYYELMLAPGAREALIKRMQQTMLTDPLPLLIRITAPTLLVWGKQDAMIPFSNAANYTSAIAGSQLVALDGVGHLPQEEAAEASLPAVKAFLLQ